MWVPLSAFLPVSDFRVNYLHINNLKKERKLEKLQRQRFFYFSNYGGLYAFPLQLSDQNPKWRKLKLRVCSVALAKLEFPVITDSCVILRNSRILLIFRLNG